MHGGHERRTISLDDVAERNGRLPTTNAAPSGIPVAAASQGTPTTWTTTMPPETVAMRSVQNFSRGVSRSASHPITNAPGMKPRR